MAETIESIEIEVSCDTADAERRLDALIERFEKIRSAATGANKPLGTFGRAMKKLDGILSGQENMSKLRTLADGISALGSIGKISISKTIAERISSIGEAVDGLRDVDMSKLREMADALAKLAGAGNIRMPNMSAAANRSAGGGAPSAPSDASDNGAAASVQIEATNSELVTTLTLAQKIKQSAAGTLNVVKQISDTLVSSIKKKLDGIVKMFTSRVVYRAMNALISLIVNGFRDGVGMVYQYSKAINGRLAASLDTVATSAAYLRASLGAAAAPVINMLAPAVERLTDGFVNVLNIVNQVLARLSGADTWTRAVKVTQEYAAATDTAADANKKLADSVLGFDELNVISDHGSATAPGMSGYRFEEVPIDNDATDDALEKLQNILTVVISIGAAAKGWALADKLADLKFDKASAVVNRLTLTALGLTIEIAGMVDIIKNGANGTNFTEMLIGALGVTAGGAKLGSLLGSGIIGGAIGAIAGGVPMFISGIYSSLSEGISWISAALTAAGSTLAGAGIGAIIGACGGPIGAGIGALIGLAVGAITDLTIYIVQNWDKVSEFLAGIGTWIWDNIFVPVGGFFSGVADWVWDNVFVPVSGFFSGVADWIWSNVFVPVMGFFSNIADWIYGNIIVPIKVFFSSAVNAVSSVFANLYNQTSEIIAGIRERISLVIYKIREVILKIAEIFAALGSAFSTYVIKPVAGFIADTAKVFYEKIAEAGQYLSGIAVWVWNNVFVPIGAFFSGVADWIWNNVFVPVGGFFSGVADWIWSNVFVPVGEFFASVPNWIYENVILLIWKRIIWLKEKAVSIFETVGTAIVNFVSNALRAAINGVFIGIEGLINGFIKMLNGAIGLINKIPGVNISTVSELRIPRLASGGFPDAGELFIAREAGAEMVGSIGGRTAVANNDQIVEGIKQGVREAMAESGGTHGGSFDVKVYLDGREVTAAVEKRQRERGATIYPGGVLDGV